MPSFFTFQQGSEARSRPPQDASPLLGRFRAVPISHRNSHSSLQRSGIFVSLGYGTIFGIEDSDGESDDDEGAERRGWRSWARTIKDVYISPNQSTLRRALERWWLRWFILVGIPAIIAVVWCALPFPQYEFPEDVKRLEAGDGTGGGHRTPGHGEARMQVNFWFFLFIYYGFYNVTALVWITKVFNIYSLNWWPESIGFPFTVSIILAVSVGLPIPVYCFAETRGFLVNNTAWILWTFVTMSMPVAVAFGILMNHERHLGLRQSLSETQRIFTQSWWTNEADVDTVSRRDRRRPHADARSFDPDPTLNIVAGRHARPPVREAVRLRKLWLPASFMRFMWFCLALFIGLLAYVLGEVYAEIYLRTLPHSNIETIVYVYSWVATIHLLDALTGFILGGNDGERVGSYPLGWVFKLYFSLTYQTYVRALYARLRSPAQFILLQAISSASLILFYPVAMSSPFHTMLTVLKLNMQPYILYRKYAGRTLWIRSIAENVSMLAFLGQIVVLHYGTNKEIYPYFAFDDPDQLYTFGLTFYASVVTWACELAAGWIVRRLVYWIYKFNVAHEGRRDLIEWPELVPTCTAVILHVLQNMLFSIVRLQFH